MAAPDHERTETGVGVTVISRDEEKAVRQMSRTGWPSKDARKGALPSTVEGHRPKDERRSSRQMIVLRHSCSYRSERATSKTSSGAAVAGVTRMGRDPS